MFRSCFLVLLTLLFFSCSDGQMVNGGPNTVFTLVSDGYSGVRFSNIITESDTLNYYTYPYLYMGGGVAVGDINNDGLQDLFFTGNMVPNKLYLNKGGLQFEDISKSAGVLGDDRWYTGVTMADVNNDGWMDIYLSVSGKNQKPVNQLLINNQDLSFSEQAAVYGLADASPSIQSTFFDYDKDGHLDVFVANYPQFEVSMGNYFYSQMMKENLHKHSGHLYHNEQNGTFKDVTAEANVQNLGLTLGIVASDINNDGWPDLYLSNDFNIPDYFYINNKDSTFSEVIKESTNHTAMFGMGVDAADFNNDGLLDIVQADMTPSDHKRSKMNMAGMSQSIFHKAVELGFHYQYMQNTLQINNGTTTSGLPVFSDISQMTGLSNTDWSWSTLFVDLNNDGLKDVFITNGILRDVNNNDANLNFDKASFFGSKKDYTKLPSTPIANYAFQNMGNLGFTDKTEDWGLGKKGFSNGVAYGDLDNDGDLELVVNNVNSTASIYKNSSPQEHHYLRIKLQGPKSNPFGIGSKVAISHDGKNQYIELTLTRGFQSSVEPFVHFGLGGSNVVEKVKIIWPDGKTDYFENIPSNQMLKIDYHDSPHKEATETMKTNLTFSKSQNTEIPFLHIEDDFNDFAKEPLLPHKNSNLGPCSAVGDVNSDGLIDIFIGNAEDAVARLLIQTTSGEFEIRSGPWEKDSIHEDTGCVLVDLDNDNDLDLYVVSGGNDSSKESSFYQDRIYYNENGHFTKVRRLPTIVSSGKVVVPMDFDQDGDMDLFVGGRVVPSNYPFAPESIILENLGGANDQMSFKKLDEQKIGELKNIGLITAAQWHDLNGDGNKQLVVTGEWMGILIFNYENGHFSNVSKKYGLANMTGWWSALEISDIDNDGDQDLIVGNLGQNYKYKASEKSPFFIYANDFDKNGTSDIVLSYEKHGKNLPLRGRECSSEQIPGISRKFRTFESFADASLEEIYGESMLKQALHLQANTFEHVWLENINGKFISHPLPRWAQISSIEAILPFDYNGDEFPDFIVAGNLYSSEVETTRNDASIGLVLEGIGKKGFRAVPASESGLMVKGEVRGIHEIKTNNNERLIIFAINNEKVDVFRLREINSSLKQVF